jgi:transcriptional regulator with XRE-family HTH domain
MDKLISRELGYKTRELRLKNNISQQKLAKLLGISRPTISQMENGEREISVDELIRFTEIFNTSSEFLLGIKRQPEVYLVKDSEDREYGLSTRIDVPQKNTKKFREALLYIFNKVGSKPNISEIVIYKLLYFIDFDFYEKYEKQLIGATYIKNNYGPTPLEFQKIIDQLIEDEEITKVVSKYFEFPYTKHLLLKKPTFLELKGNEIEIIENVLNRLSDMNANQISEYSHNDVPWLVTEDQDKIEYETVFYRTFPYSARDYIE